MSSRLLPLPHVFCSGVGAKKHECVVHMCSMCGEREDLNLKSINSVCVGACVHLHVYKFITNLVGR